MATSRLTTAFLNLDASPFNGKMLAVLGPNTITELSDSTVYVQGSTWTFAVVSGQAYQADGVTLATLPVTQSGSATPGNVPITLYLVDANGAERYYASVIIPPESGGVPVVLASLPAVSPSLTAVGASVTGINVRGAWSSVTAYATHDAVQYQGSLWHANQASTNQTPALASIYWDLMVQATGVYQVPWSSATAYNVGDVVWHAATSKSWVAKQAGTNQTPAVGSAYWNENTIGVTGLTAAASVAVTDELALNQTDRTKKATVRQLADAIATSPSAAGSPATTFNTAQTFDLAVPMQKLSLTGAVTSMSTLSRVAGRMVCALVLALADGTFTRASAANDLYTGAATVSGSARFCQPPNNLCTASESMSSASTRNNVSIRDAAIAADTLRPFPLAKLWDTTVNNSHYIGFTTTLKTGSPATVAFYAKADELGFVWVNFNNGLTEIAYFNLTTGAVGTVAGAGVTASIEPIGGGVYRCIASHSSLVAAGANIGICAADNTASYTGTGKKGAYVGAVMVTQTASAGGYSPTGTTLPSQGLVIEEGTTNLLTANQSDVETNTAGFSAAFSATLTRDTTTFWQGSASLKCVTPNAVAGEGVSLSTFAATSGQAYTFSVWLKGSGTVRLAMNGAIATTYSGVITLTSTWTRYSLTLTATSTAGMFTYVVTDVQQGITYFCDGLQAEAKSYPSSWVQGGVTRNSETFAVPTTGTISITQGAIFAKVYIDGALLNTVSTSAMYILSHADGSSFNRIFLRKNGTVWDAQLRDTTGANIATASWAGTAVPGWYIIGMAYNSTDVAIWVQTVRQGATPTGSSLPGTLVGTASIALGLNQPMAWFATFTTRPSDADMAAFTNLHDPGVPQRLSDAATYFIDFGSISAANGGNLAPTRAVALNAGWAVLGTRPTKLYSGKRAELELACYGTTEADVTARWTQAA